jgi:hypothetical protein
VRGERVGEAAFAEPGLGHERLGVLGKRHEARARPLRQRLRERNDLFLQHPRDEPLAALLARLVERVDRQRHGDAVARVAGLVQVARRAVDAAEADRLRKRRRRDSRRLVAHQLVARQHQEPRLTLGRVAVPALEGRAARDVRGQLLIVEREDELVVDEHVLAARLVLELLDLAHELAVRGHERQLRVPVAGDERLADEDLARGGRVDAGEVDAPVGVDDDAVERRALERDDLRRLLLPVRLEQLRLDEVPGERRQPARLDRGDAARVEARRLDELGGDDPLARLLRQARAGMAPEADAARAEVRLVLVALDADVAEQPGEHRLVELLVRRRRRVESPAVLGDDGLQLRVDVAPLAHAPRRDEVLAQQLLVLALDKRCSPWPPRDCSSQLQSLSVPRNSDFSSSNFACAWSAACCCSSGRSRTSWTLSALATTSTSRSASRPRASRIMRPMRGSSGSRASSRPIAVSALRSSAAPSSCSSCQPSAIARRGGASTNGNSSTLPRPSDCIRRMTPASDERTISGSVNRGRAAKSASS